MVISDQQNQNLDFFFFFLPTPTCATESAFLSLQAALPGTFSVSTQMINWLISPLTARKRSSLQTPQYILRVWEVFWVYLGPLMTQGLLQLTWCSQHPHSWPEATPTESEIGFTFFFIDPVYICLERGFTWNLVEKLSWCKIKVPLSL